MRKPFCVGVALLLYVPTLGLAHQESPHSRGSVPAAAAISSATSTAEGMIKLDVMVTDKSGDSIAGLEPGDFTLLDHGMPAKIVSFQAFNELDRPEPPVEIILVIDLLNLPLNKHFVAEKAAERFYARTTDTSHCRLCDIPASERRLQTEVYRPPELRKALLSFQHGSNHNPQPDRCSNLRSTTS